MKDKLYIIYGLAAGIAIFAVNVIIGKNVRKGVPVILDTEWDK